MKKWTRFKYQPNLPLKKDGSRVTASVEHIALSRQVAREGMVLLKNEKDLLPLKGYHRIALLGKGSYDYVKGGGGSGDVTCAYVKGLYEGFSEKEEIDIFQPAADFYKKYVKHCYAKGEEPGMLAETQLPQELLQEAAAYADVAVYTISRFSGESWDRSDVESPKEEGFPKFPRELEEKMYWMAESLPTKAARVFPKGDFYLTEEEEKALLAIEEVFDHVIVVLNVGGMMATGFIKDDERIEAALLMWQPGMEGGSAAADLITGEATPCGHLPDTFARTIEDYPSTENFFEDHEYVEYTDDIYVGYRYFETIPDADQRIVYPFGYGLSYTRFEQQLEGIAYDMDFQNMEVQVKVANTGKYPGKDLVLLRVEPPKKGKLDKPAHTLVAFQKTRLLEPGESQILTLYPNRKSMASYDDEGRIQKGAWVLEKGEYHMYIGDVNPINDWTDDLLVLGEDVIVEQLQSHLAPSKLTRRMNSDGRMEPFTCEEPKEQPKNVLEPMPDGMTEGVLPQVKPVPSRHFWDNELEKIHDFSEVAEGKISLETFMEQLSIEDRISLLGGQPNTGVANTFGIGNLPLYGVPNTMTADGPAGVRIAPECGINTTDFPCATLVAATFDTDLSYAVGRAGGEELLENNLAMWLTPAVNIHRNPMCGRNFEYYSEDPLVAGKMAAGMVRGIQSNGVSCSVKHFAVNNKETNRKHSDSRVSERALREIYLRVFEIIVKEADPWAIMSSYNILNGVPAAANRELLTDVLRDEWDFKGIVTTDWWNRSEHYQEILAGSDVKMGCGYPERVKEALEKGAVSEEQINLCARRVLEYILKLR